MTASSAPSPVALRRVGAARFVVALREGGSLPGLIEGDDGRLWVTKLRGAGQGAGALVAEVIAGELARTLGLPMPELVVLDLPPKFGVTDGDPEVNELLAASVGANVGMAFLPAALTYDPAARLEVDAELAARIVAFDVLMANVDRTFRNPNLMWAERRLWLIDHGAALYWQHGWQGGLANAAAPLPRFAEHVLLPLAGDLTAAATWLGTAADDDALTAALAAVPDAWLEVDDPAARRAAFLARLQLRRAALPTLVASPPPGAR